MARLKTFFNRLLTEKPLALRRMNSKRIPLIQALLMKGSKNLI
jgi:hypothetical protein